MSGQEIRIWIHGHGNEDSDGDDDDDDDGFVPTGFFYTMYEFVPTPEIQPKSWTHINTANISTTYTHTYSSLLIISI